MTTYQKAKLKWWARCVLRWLLGPLNEFHMRWAVLWAAGTTPIFIDTPKCPSGRATVANTNRDGATGTYVTLYTAGADGCLFAGWRWTMEVTSTAGFVRLFRQAAGAGNVELLKEMVVAAVTPAVGVTPVAEGEWYPPGGIWGDAGAVFKVSTQIGEASGHHLEGGGDY